ncbi:kinase-like domain-containing protein [Nemania sp. FL0916]|nr:kinase-like domain-containing protein [Nemania sp. FL0916]
MVTNVDIPDPVQDSRWEVEFKPNPHYPSQVVNTQPSGRRLLHQEIWIRERILGHGGFGVVWLEKAHSSNQLSAGVRAVKELKLGQEDDRRRECIQELEALIKFSHRKFVDSFVEFYSWFENKDSLFIATEYCQHGDLKQFVHDHGHIPEEQAQIITDQVLQGIIFMHDSGFAHRDLKPANILIKKRPPNDEWHVKICDMGLSKRINAEKVSTTIKGTPGFVAPERIPGIGSSPSAADPFPSDMWCLGETAFFLLTGGTTFENYSKLQAYVNGTLKFPRHRLEAIDVSSSAAAFIELLMAVQPSERLSANRADYHQWITSISNSVGIPPSAMFDQFPMRPHSIVQSPAGGDDELQWRAPTPIRTTTQDGNGAQPSDTVTIASGTWETLTIPISPHFEGNNSLSNTTPSNASTMVVKNTGTAKGDPRDDVQAHISPPLSDASCEASEFDGYSDYAESTGSEPSAESRMWEFEGRNFPSLLSLQDSKSKSDQKYVFNIRTAIRYIIESGGFQEQKYDYTRIIPTHHTRTITPIYEDQEEDAFLSDNQASGLDDDDHALKKTKFDAQLDRNSEEGDASPGISTPVPDVEKTRHSGEGAVTTNYRQPTVEDAEDFDS